MDNDVIKKALKEAIYRRRSSRAYTEEQVPDDLIEEILDAGRHAPSASNKQNTHFIVITNAEKLAELRNIISTMLSGLEEQAWMSPAIVALIKRAKEGPVDVTYGAPALIVTANKKESPNTPADCGCAMQNMMLTASALGLGNCWINQFFSFRDAPPVAGFFAGIGVAEDEAVCGALALGFAQKLETEPLPRTGNPVTYVR